MPCQGELLIKQPRDLMLLPHQVGQQGGTDVT